MYTTEDHGIELLKTLQDALSGELQAAANYQAYARNADLEGHHVPAALFRSVAYAENVHARNHVEAIRGLGEIPQPEPVRPPVVESTHANLSSSIAGEELERDSGYPRRITVASGAHESQSLRSLILAAMAEAGHAQMFSDALGSLHHNSPAEARFFVCPTCGNVTDTNEIRFCTVCHGDAANLLGMS
jgi:rubrerythrin